MQLRKPPLLAREEPRVVRQERHINKRTVQQFLAAAIQKRGDALRVENSGPTRLETAYDAVLFCALAIFAAQGYRVSSAPGHHALALEGLAAELSLSMTVFDELQLLLESRNSKYTGVTQVSVADLNLALGLLERVLSKVEAWLQANSPDLLK